MARPRVPLLSKPIIRDTALKLVDENGLTDFSMRKLAHRPRRAGTVAVQPLRQQG